MSLFREGLRNTGINEASSNEELPTEIIEFLTDELKECIKLDDWHWNDPTEVESKNRDGFWAWTDGGAFVTTWADLSSLTSSGVYPKSLEKTVDAHYDEVTKDALEEFIKENPEVIDIENRMRRAGIDYSSLYEAGEGELAEILSEKEQEMGSTYAYEIKVGCHYYKKDNDRNPLNKGDVMTVFAEVGILDARTNIMNKELNILVDFHNDKGFKKAKKDIGKAIKKVIKKIM